MKRVQVDEKTPRLRDVLAQIIAHPVATRDVVIAAAELVIADEYFNIWFPSSRRGISRTKTFSPYSRPQR